MANGACSPRGLLADALCAAAEAAPLHCLLAVAGAVALLLAAVFLYARRKASVYVLDFSVFAPPDSWKFPVSAIRRIAEKDGRVLPEHIDFMERLAQRTGLSDMTPVPAELHCGDRNLVGVEYSRREFAMTCITTIEDLFAKTGIKPGQIDFVITNCSLFCPTPSLSAMVMNHFKMSSRCRGYSLGGMGCSSGVIAMDLGKELLQQHPGSYALVISHENISNATYPGKEPSMLLPNCLFRANGAAVLLTSKPADTRRSKYLIKDIVRTNMAADDVAYGCVQQTEDAEKIVGVRLTMDVIKTGERALRQNMTVLGPKVLPWSEKLAFAANFVVRKVARRSKALSSRLPEAWMKPYVPDFKKAFDYFCIHTGGRGIIDGLEKEMKLTRPLVEPSRATLYRFGNVSSTSVWYDLAYIESRQAPIKRGDRLWQLAFGSGFKFNSAVLVANRAIKDEHPAWKVFDREAMWEKLDALEAAARAGRAAKAARLAKEAADKAAAEKAAAAAAEKAAAAEEDEGAVVHVQLRLQKSDTAAVKDQK